MLYLIGENFDKTRAHNQAETGKIIQLVRGIGGSNQISGLSKNGFCTLADFRTVSPLGLSAAAYPSAIGSWENNILLDKDVESVARTDDEGRLDVEIAGDGLVSDPAEAFSEIPSSRVRRSILRR